MADSSGMHVSVITFIVIRKILRSSIVFFAKRNPGLVVKLKRRAFAYLIWFDCSDLFVTKIMVNAGFSRHVINEIHFCPPMFSYSVIDELWS